MSSENTNVYPFPEPEAKLLTREDNPMFFNESGDCEPFPKRWKSSSSPQIVTQQPTPSNELPVPQCQYYPLTEPSPLGLRLRKSPSLLELAQKRLNECSTDKGDLPVEDVEEQTKRDLKAKTRARASSSIDKLKASHFHALLLRIGRWEYVSKHEGDLVAKCYFSKHKIVWEVLDSGLKKKLEINWADIVGLKANLAANGPGSLTIVLDKPPIFFKEINPQPRKHTQWRSTSDFTNGEASTQRQHILQCTQGVLDKHYEKLIQCDTRLHFLSQQQNIVSKFPYFTPKTSISDQNMFNLPDFHSVSHMASPSTLLVYPPTTVESGPLGFIHHNNLPVSENTPGPEYPNNPNAMLENISQMLLGDNQFTAASDERTVMSRVNSLCSLLQDYQHCQNSQQSVNDGFTPHQVRNDSSTPDSILTPVNSTPTCNNQITTSTPGSSQMVQQDGNDNSTPESDPQPGISRNDSFAELVHQLPRIASLPRFLFDISENGEILK